MPRFQFKRSIERICTPSRKRGVSYIYGSHKLVSLVIAGAIIMFGSLYVVQINTLAAKGFHLNELEYTAAELHDTNDSLRLEIADLRSTKVVKQKLEKMELVSVSRVEYISPSASEVAIAR